MQRRDLLKFSLALPFASARAQAYPAKPLRLVVPFPPGGPTDIFARQYAQRLGAAMGQQVIVENKVGASGAIGSVDVMRSAPDGYSLLFGTASTHALYNLINQKPQYDALKDFSHVAIVGGAAIVFAVHPSQPSTLKGVVDAARAKPGALRYGSPGTGTMMHLAAERMKKESGSIDILHVPYKGSAQAKADLLGGQIEMFTDTLGASLADHRAGKIRILAVASAKRSPQAPDVPTVDEALGIKGFEAILWNVVAAPAGTPAAVMDALSAATAKVMSDASLQESLAKFAIEPQTGSNPAAAAAHIRAEMGRWKAVVDAVGIRVE